jgi:uncharacterized protein YdaU (DUF1376 family)
LILNYYEHHLGDYAQATAHLSFVEDAAYSRCIRKYYADERPLPANIAAVQRLVGARTREEREAVAVVLKEFFVLADDGWHNKRCDEEISRYQDKRTKAKRSADARWNREPEHTDGNADAMRTHSEGNAHQTPDTRHHSSTAIAVGKKKATTDKPADVTDQVWESFLTLRRAKKAPVTEAALAGIQRECEKAGLSLEQALEHCCARGWTGFKAEWVRDQQGSSMTRQGEANRTVLQGLTRGIMGGNNVKLIR